MIKAIKISHPLILNLRIKKEEQPLFSTDLEIKENSLQHLFMVERIQVNMVRLLHLEGKNF
jgi:hypothetical protein